MGLRFKKDVLPLPRDVQLWKNTILRQCAEYSFDPAIAGAVIATYSWGMPDYRQYMQHEVAEVVQFLPKSQSLSIREVCSCYGLYAVNYYKVCQLGIVPVFDKMYDLDYNFELFITVFSSVEESDIVYKILQYPYVKSIHSTKTSIDFNKRSATVTENLAICRKWFS